MIPNPTQQYFRSNRKPRRSRMSWAVVSGNAVLCKCSHKGLDQMREWYRGRDDVRIRELTSQAGAA